MCPRETKRFVTDVPTFAPIMMGIAFVMESALAPTIPTTTQVVVEELCTRLVAKIPITSPIIGLDVVSMSCWAKSSPNNLKALLISVILNKKR